MFFRFSAYKIYSIIVIRTTSCKPSHPYDWILTSKSSNKIVFTCRLYFMWTTGKSMTITGTSRDLYNTKEKVCGYIKVMNHKYSPQGVTV